MGPEPEGSAYLLEGIGEAMVTRLSKVSGLRVLPWLTTAAYSDSGRTPEDLGRELNVDELLVGTFVMAGDHIHVTVAVVDARKGWQVWGDQFEEPTSDILTMQKNLALAVATSLKGRLSGQEEELVSRGPTENAAAYADYLKGSHLLRDGSEQATTLALDYFDRALRADSSLVEAYVGAGAAETRRYFQGWEGGEAGLDQAEERFSRALALDPGSVAARRGMIRVKWERSDTEGCLLLGKQLADQGKDDIESLVARGEAYFLGGLPEMAPPLLQQALQLDPHNEAAAWTLPIAETWAGKPQDALLAADRFTKIFGPDPEVETWAAASYDLLGDLDRADQHYQDAIELFGDDSNLYVYLFASRVAREKGDVAGTHRLLSTGLDLAQRRLVKSPDNVRLQGFVALFQAMLGERERCETTLKSSGLAKKGHYLAQAEWVKVISAQIAWGDTATALEECRGALEYCPLGLTPPPGTARLLDWPGNLPPAFGPILKLAQEARARLVTIY
jgi:TolB-like protein